MAKENNITGRESETIDILIVDDNPQNLQVLGKLLNEMSYSVEFALNGVSALDWVGSKMFDLILLDINMPGMSGFEVCEQIRKNPEMDKIPIIFLTAETDRGSLLRGFELGAQDYVTKPFNTNELVARVKTHVNLKRSREELEILNRSLEEKVRERTYQLEQANESLKDLNEKLIDLDKAKADFMSIIGHEIRTPLNGIIGITELLKSPQYFEQLGELLEMLDLSVSRLERFSMNALLITEIKTRKPDILDKKFSPNEVIDTVRDETLRLFDSKNLKLFVKGEDMEEGIPGDKDFVKICLLQILDNAVRFSGEGDTVEINTGKIEDNFEIDVRDRGPGFGETIRPELFEAFTRGQDLHDRQAGLGLPLAKLIMDAHEGELVTMNHPEGGALVKLLFRLS